MPVFKQSYNLTTVATYSSLVWTPSPTLVRRIPDPDGVDTEPDSTLKKDRIRICPSNSRPDPEPTQQNTFS